MKMKNRKQTIFRFPLSYENEKRMNALKINSKNLLNMRIVMSVI